MDRHSIATLLRRIAETLDNRIEIWIQVVEADGTLAERIYQGSFLRNPPPVPRRPLPPTRSTR
jgi:hypothetical protein